MNRRRSKAKHHLRKVSAAGVAISDMSVVLKQKAAEAVSSPEFTPVKKVAPKLEKRESSKTALLAAAIGASAALHAVGTTATSDSSEKDKQASPSKASVVSASAESPARHTTVSLQDVVCFLCLLESGSPTDKLGCKVPLSACMHAVLWFRRFLCNSVVQTLRP